MAFNRRVNRMLGLLLLTCLVQCGGGSEPSDPSPPPGGGVTSITPYAGTGQTQRIGADISIAPAVLVADGQGHPVEGVSITFSVLGGGGSVSGANAISNQQGVATVGGWTLGPVIGAQSLRATIQGTGLAADFIATGRAPRWTVLVYMAADNNLAVSGIEDIEELEAAGTDPEVQVALQAEFSPAELALYGCNASCIGLSNFNTFRYGITGGTPRIGPDGSVVDIGNVDMTSGATLRSFVQWGRQAYPSERTLLVLWNHGGGYTGLLSDETSSPGSVMTLDKLPGALAGLPIDILDFDMCLMGGYETLESTKSLSQFVIFSEEVVPGDGNPYTAIIDHLQTNPTQTTRSLSATIVDDFNQYYASTNARSSTTVSAYDLGAYTNFRFALDAVALSFSSNLGTLGPAIASAAVASQKFSFTELTDLVSFVDSLSVRTTDQALLGQLAELRRQALGSFRVQNHARNGTGASVGTAPDVARATGLHVVLPTGIGGDLFFAGGTQSLAAYQAQWPGLPWTGFLTGWTTGQSMTSFIDQGSNRNEDYEAWDPADAAGGVDIDLWLLEPSGNLYIPYLGTVTPNGAFTPESQVAGVSFEGWLSRRYLETGQYVFYANLFSDPQSRQPTVQFLYRNDQASPLIPLYTPGTEPQLSLATSWLQDPTPTFAEADAGAYTDLRAIALLPVTAPPPGADDMKLKRIGPGGDSIETSTPVVSGSVSVPRKPIGSGFAVGPNSIAGPRTATPAITSAQLQTAKRFLLTRPPRVAASPSGIRGLPR